MIEELSRLYRRVSGRIYQPLRDAGRSRGTQGRYLLLSDCETMTDVAYNYIDELQALGDIPPSYRTTLTMKPTARFGYGRLLYGNKPRYVRDTILTLEDQRQALFATDSVFLFKGQSEKWLSFSILKGERT